MDASVIKILEEAGSQDPNVLKPAEQMLKQWETQRGFYTALFNIFSNETLTVNVRWIAVLYFKNGVDKYWRKNAPGEIAADEKAYLRQGLISNFNEPVNQLSVQLAVIIGKIARYDCPKEWASLVPTLLEVIKDNNSLRQHRALLTFHHVVKALASKRLATDQRLFQELTANVFTYILNIWNTYTESFFALLSRGVSDNDVQDSIEKALLSLRILRKLIMYGIKRPSENANAMIFLKLIFERANVSLNCRRSLLSKGILLEVCEKFIIHLTKVLLEVQEIHPFCYIDMIPISLEFTVYYCFTEAGQELSFERFNIQCLNLIKKILQSNDYKPGKAIEETKYPLMCKAHQLKHDFFTPETLTEICTRLVTHYFVLTPTDLDSWNIDPENFGVDDCGESWKYSLRPCTEAVFLTILHQFKDIFSKVLVDLIRRHHQPVNPNDLQNVLLKDAVYNAVGLAGFDLYDEVNFDEWFSTTLKHELNQQSHNHRIIRRRVCWLIGRWTGVKLSAGFRPDLYKLMIEALREDEDLGVRLAAADALKLAIDDFQFNTDDFSFFLATAFSSLFALLKEVNECDTKMRVLYVISFMIERVGNEIKPHVGALNMYLPELWHQSEHHNMLRCSIVSTLVHLVKALGSDSGILQPLVINVVELSCDMSQAGYVYLLEDGLELWLAVLENSPSSTPEIMNLFKNMPLILESSSENLRLCLYILHAYVLLNPQQFFSNETSTVVESLNSLLGDLRSEGIVMIMQFFELCLRVDLRNGTEFIRPILLRIFECVYNGDEHPMVLTVYLCIIARILLNSQVFFVQAIKEFTKHVGQEFKEDFVLEKIIRIYIDHMPLVSQHNERKLLALALCSLISADCPPIVRLHFPKMILNIVETLNDITKIDDTGCSIDSLMIDDQHSLLRLDDIEYETEHSQRKRRLANFDPVHRVALHSMLQNQLNFLRQYIGHDQLHLMLQGISREVKQQLEEYVTI
ncbi:uncharacterized protein LOC100116824 isoform X2 [Nasonia vitripennis]|uniref:Importin N-terminal domain-containing protein n=1 Tax=Nasonia vitripennis TaxID=7425 RepID=A0A7M7Q6E2_NASVI|nr:uncharacterized protein LOC100116824 isoform X2 [Nasonia vitripennis]XP_032457436.1 uncharacterized protein LOC100116824 isoform X2 [Nasonia vitripennis]